MSSLLLPLPPPCLLHLLVLQEQFGSLVSDLSNKLESPAIDEEGLPTEDIYL